MSTTAHAGSAADVPELSPPPDESSPDEPVVLVDASDVDPLLSISPVDVEPDVLPSLGSPVSEAPSPVLPLVSGVPLLSMLHPEPSPAGEGDTSISTQHPARVVKRTERAKVVLFIGVARAYPTPHLATQAPQEVAHRSCR
jgi:hypothetical protein